MENETIPGGQAHVLDDPVVLERLKDLALSSCLLCNPDAAESAEDDD